MGPLREWQGDRLGVVLAIDTKPVGPGERAKQGHRVRVSPMQPGVVGCHAPKFQILERD
jgi:hypothetical protein